MRDLGEQIYKVKLIITTGEALFPPTALPLPLSHRAPVFFFFSVYCSFICPASKFEATAPSRGDKVTALAEVTRSHIEFNKQMFTQAPLHQHFVILSLSKTLWEQIEQHKGWDIKKKNPYREPDHVYALDKGMGAGRMAWKEMCRAEFHGLFFSFWFIQRLLCVGYSKPSILPHPGGKSSELHAWVVLHLTAAIQ